MSVTRGWLALAVAAGALGCTPRAEPTGASAEVGMTAADTRAPTPTPTAATATARLEASAGDARPLAGCRSDADCRAFSDYCGGCTCRALRRDDPPPECGAPPVMCYVDPCGASTAACDPATGACVLQRKVTPKRSPAPPR